VCLGACVCACVCVCVCVRACVCVPLQVVLSQGIATIQGYTPTKEGLDEKLAIHYYARVAFVQAGQGTRLEFLAWDGPLHARLPAQKRECEIPCDCGDAHGGV
jgi:hypothetical protein